MERREPRNPWIMLYRVTNRGSGVGTYAPCRGLTVLLRITPDCAPTANAVCATSGAVTPSALPGFKTSQIKLDQASRRYVQMKNALKR